MHRKWSEKEIKLLEKFFPKVNDTITIHDLVKLFNRTETAIKAKAHILGLKSFDLSEQIDYEVLKQLEKRITV